MLQLLVNVVHIVILANIIVILALRLWPRFG